MMSTSQLVSVNQTLLLTTLLPSTTYTLAYVLPLLLASLCLTFAGAFLTLDRSRAFPPNYDSISSKQQIHIKKLHWYLEGGIGGLAAGYVFGVHLSTFLALIIPSLSSSGSLTKQSFLVIWILSVLTTTFPCGRWRYCALAAAGIAGGATFALSLSVIIHPSLLSRVVLAAIAVPCLTILTVLPLPRFQHGFLRFALSAVGAFGVVLSIGLFSGIESWADVWDRFWVADGPVGVWGSSREKGLSAAYCFFLVAGVSSDWVLRRKFGENPDQKWDSYLATYSQNLPNRAGHFQPLTSIWARLLGLVEYAKLTKPDEVVPTEYDLKPCVNTPLELQEHLSTLPPRAFEFQTLPSALKKGRSQRTREKVIKSRNPIKFGGDWSSSDSEPESDEVQTPMGKETSWIDRRSSVDRFSSSPTLIHDAEDIDVEQGMRRMKAGLGKEEALDYSDYEEDDVTSAALKNREVHGWSPEFLRRASVGSSATSQRAAVIAQGLPIVSAPLPPAGAVPVTPSQIKALDRIAVAQQTAFAPSPVRPGLPASKSSESATVSGLPRPRVPVNVVQEDKAAKWDAFWQDVRDKAAR